MVRDNHFIEAAAILKDIIATAVVIFIKSLYLDTEAFAVKGIYRILVIIRVY